jgi:hypothetical protein
VKEIEIVGVIAFPRRVQTNCDIFFSKFDPFGKFVHRIQISSKNESTT